MKIGVISDIHGNYPSLNAVLNHFKDNDVKKIICLGDMIGYFHQSLEVMELVMKSKISTILGNHEAYLLGLVDCPPEKWMSYNLEPVRQSISPSVTNWLHELNQEMFLEINRFKIAFFHGSPWDPLNEYIYSDSKSFDKFNDLSYDIVVLGHTHYQMKKTITNTEILNPGSCGFPRDKKRCACAAIMDVGDDVQIDLLQIDYDIESFIESTKGFTVNYDALEKLSK